MKTTGIVRRVDDLGRVVIPKEILRFMRIKGGDALEIFTSDEGITFRKYLPNYYDELDMNADGLRDDAYQSNGKHQEQLFDIARKLSEVAKEIRQLEAE